MTKKVKKKWAPVREPTHKAETDYGSSTKSGHFVWLAALPPVYIVMKNRTLFGGFCFPAWHRPSLATIYNDNNMLYALM